MAERWGPPKPKWPTGPCCGPHVRPDGLSLPECPYRKVSQGYAPVSSQNIRVGEGGTESVNGSFPQHMILLEALGADEVEEGENAVGPTGRKLDYLLRKSSNLRRGNTVIANTVRCRPIEYDLDGKPLRNYKEDYINAKPTPGQIRECAQRYTDDLLDQFAGKTIVALGATPLQYMMGRAMSIQQYRGTIFEPGLTKTCRKCGGDGRVQGKMIKCKGCDGRGTSPCAECGRKTKHLKSCSGIPFFMCAKCQGSCQERGRPRRCPECEGAGEISSDPEKPNVCKKLKPGQVLFASFHPAYLSRNPTQEEAVLKDLERIEILHDELTATVTDAEYTVYPTRPDWILQAETLSIDLETARSLDPTEGDIRCWGVTDGVGRGSVLGPRSPYLQPALERPIVVGQNFVLYDWWWLHHKGYHIPKSTRVVDTRYLGKLLNPDTPNDLVYLTRLYADPPIQGYWKTKADYRNNIEKVAAIDVDATLRVYHGQMEQIRVRGQEKLVWDYIVPLSRVLFDLRVGGMRIDRTVMDETRVILDEELAEIRQTFPWSKGNSPGTEGQHARVQEYLYGTVGLPRMSKMGKLTSDRTARDELISRLTNDHRTVKKIDSDLQAEALVVLNNLNDAADKSKLMNAFMKYKLDGDEFIHPALNMGGSARGKHDPAKGAATWRLSCVEPNAQQVPKKARHLFIPDYPDWEIISVDLVQAEIVVILCYAEAWGVLEDVLKHGADAYAQVATLAEGRTITKATDEATRDAYKTNTLAGAYGEKPSTSAKRLGITTAESRAMLESVYKVLPGLKSYREETIRMSERLGYVESVFGFRRYVRAESDEGRAANIACNQRVQNVPPTAIGRAMIKIHEELPAGRMLMQVHDELVLTAPKDKRREVLECVVEHMRRPIPELPCGPIGMHSGLRFNVDVAVGPNWRDVKDVGI